MLNRQAAKTIARAALPVVALALGACAWRVAADDGYGEPYGGTEVVAETSYPTRVHYRDPDDSLNVYYYDEGRPDVVFNRPVYRENDGRTYYVEHEGGADRRFYYDDRKAMKRPHKNVGRAGDDGGHDRR